MTHEQHREAFDVLNCPSSSNDKILSLFKTHVDMVFFDTLYFAKVIFSIIPSQ